MTNSPASLAIVALAAGKGTRMYSDLPKVLHPLNGKPLIHYVLQTARQLDSDKIVLVVGHQADLVRQAAGDSVFYAEQVEQLGTGHAVAQAESVLQDHRGDVLILYGDMPLFTSKTLQKLIDMQAENDGPLTILTVNVDEPRGFGRIVRDQSGAVKAIVEEVDCSPEQLAIKELNVGVYCVRADWLWHGLSKIELSSKGEFFLTDLVAIAVSEGLPVQAFVFDDLIETIGINTPEQLALAEEAVRQRASMAGGGE